MRSWAPSRPRELQAPFILAQQADGREMGPERHPAPLRVRRLPLLAPWRGLSLRWSAYTEIDELGRGCRGRMKRHRDQALILTTPPGKEDCPAHKGETMAASDHWRDMLLAEDNLADAELVRGL
jgi:hypothetical protein